MTLTNVLRFAGQRLAPMIAPSGGKALLREAALGAGANLALEQGLPRVLGNEPPPIERSLIRSAAIGGLSGPVERTVLAGLKRAVPGVSALEGQLASGLGQMGVPGQVPTRLAGLAAGAGKLGVGVLGATAITDPVSNAIANTFIPEGYSSGQSRQGYADIPVTVPTGQEVPIATADDAATEHQRRLELTYARNYKFPSYIYHISQGGTSNPFEIANQMVSTPTTRYF